MRNIYLTKNLRYFRAGDEVAGDPQRIAFHVISMYRMCKTQLYIIRNRYGAGCLDGLTNGVNLLLNQNVRGGDIPLLSSK